ncbi:hypothetical protein Y1Q_0024078 [Alligator mississippiensis]|uniref:Uncharacterized protein n=1 Tax=Alligator mississippiensis TaxID=8496 RepID=A0A151NIH6_ALLMI|nr:hypothetical protein Y1Q_0024078 [Alligator mississippiensis]
MGGIVLRPHQGHAVADAEPGRCGTHGPATRTQTPPPSGSAWDRSGTDTYGSPRPEAEPKDPTAGPTPGGTNSALGARSTPTNGRRGNTDGRREAGLPEPVARTSTFLSLTTGARLGLGPGRRRRSSVPWAKNLLPLLNLCSA